MNEYQRLETKLTSYLARQEVIRTNNIISFYDLYKALDDKFKVLRGIQFNSDLITKINSNSSKDKKKKEKDFIINTLDSILATTEKATSKITFFYGIGGNPKTFTLLKDFDDDDIYFSSNTTPNKEFVKTYYQDITSIFKILEEYAKLTKGDIGINADNGNLKPMTFTDGFLTISIIYEGYGKINTDISINLKEDKNAVYKKEWYTRKRLADFVDENSEEILKKIPVNISDITNPYREIVLNTINK